MGWKADVIETLATIKANGNNHNGELQEFKKDFKAHLIKEERQRKDDLIVIDQVKCKLQNLDCPYEERFETVEKEQREHGKSISSLTTTRKYNLTSTAGLWAAAVIILKKVFMT